MNEIESSMVSITEATSHTNSEWPDELQRLYALAPLDATHVFHKSYKKFENNSWHTCDTHGRPWFKTDNNRTAEYIKIPDCERELNRLADGALNVSKENIKHLKQWNLMPEEIEDRRALRTEAGLIESEQESAETEPTYRYTIEKDENGRPPVNGQTYLNFPSLTNEQQNMVEDYALQLVTEPVKEQEPWNGEGLPPVGVECEWFSYRANCWTITRVVAYDGDGQAWLEGEGVVDVDRIGDQFRMTSKQQAEKERNDWITKASNLFIRATEELSAFEAHWSDLGYGAIYDWLQAKDGE